MTKQELGNEIRELMKKFCDQYRFCEECPLRIGAGQYECEPLWRCKELYK